MVSFGGVRPPWFQENHPLFAKTDNNNFAQQTEFELNRAQAVAANAWGRGHPEVDGFVRIYGFIGIHWCSRCNAI